MRIGFTFNVKPGVSAPDVDDRYAEWEDEETIAGVEAALARAGGVIAQAAAELGLSRQALYRRMEKLSILRE